MSLYLLLVNNLATAPEQCKDGSRAQRNEEINIGLNGKQRQKKKKYSASGIDSAGERKEKRNWTTLPNRLDQ